MARGHQKAVEMLFPFSNWDQENVDDLSSSDTRPERPTKNERKWLSCVERLARPARKGEQRPVSKRPDAQPAPKWNVSTAANAGKLGEERQARLGGRRPNPNPARRVSEPEGGAMPALARPPRNPDVAAIHAHELKLPPISQPGPQPPPPPRARRASDGTEAAPWRTGGLAFPAGLV
uniref:Uncharacterized protein n=1 Tax=Tetraselmis sp. GSL018 TaxID=582737 RepID=A0A061RHT0_9CHLO